MGVDAACALTPAKAAYAPTAVQRTLLRVAAARGDVLAIIHGPREARPGQVGDAIDRLSEDRSPDGDDVRALGHGAAYHPWVRSADGVARPPDGAATGVLAATAVATGPWAAPANQVLTGVLAVHPTGLDPLALLASHVNPIGTSARGVVAQTARTLTPLVDGLDRIGPRRLVMLLRRLAEREGAVYAFEPDGPALHAQIRTTFTSVLTDLFTRGALAGVTPAEAFEVAMSSGPLDRDNGRVLIELRIAPSRPLEFIVVRLLELGTGALTVEVAP
jgi:hypothetical protein